MGLSRQARIITLLVIDSIFFLIELITGYAVGSLALVADSFHMLNDVLSLIVALYTIRLATSPSSSANSYGWQRAEILGALINGVFLVALCVSIGLEAIGRIVSPPEISNAQLIVVVGSLGLLSNIVGLFLFHDHGHSHGGHSHGAVALPDDADETTSLISRDDSVSDLYQHPAQTRAQVIETAQEFGYGGTQLSSSLDSRAGYLAKSPNAGGHGRTGSASRRTKRGSFSRAGGHSRLGSANVVPPVPGQNDVLPPVGGDGNSTSSSTVVDNGKKKASKKDDHDQDRDREQEQGSDNGKKLAGNASDAESGHTHGSPAEHGRHGGHGHSHGAMNMRGVFLHVVGDALGNVGVISAGLVIWFCQGRWTLYFDPGVSLVITCIIFSSALPLVKSASYILMQGVPSHVSLDAVRQCIYEVPGVDSVHELHIWQLSESTVVASVHVMIEAGRDYMVVASGIRERMHSHGIHSVTIQPEFYCEETDPQDTEACLIRCPPGQCSGDTCCPPGVKITGPEGDEGNGHDHEH
ncbi:solute carrier family 30 (zinc transporter), member 1 [Cryptococcus neoformans AD2-60a]|uniref:Solute carrier family 30 (Zinc transporter), member 1 n=1 Tax=Cryptococcus neoformans Tu259-1 TaxID=1230072 RepID=A0A854QIY0_CRYNE|nr:solute carrier family 30 (zinc transporter), member 1 [Cryptococcus neoformans var. grubii AD2-60a]OWZ55667.1 solute carrier family 30 (zinc transporter), member 1 [Cryptococcus neoformans var. grubii 125.91]OXC86157.1 solute carrier family 30 (zinc transporter), member 1 [Cryptococcus neoformans var. grubii AD1-7a]OXG25823.1 solute carrier family 30 (zinc transporter), member 1 [Cryptococcus neoformans var. grubii Tu259-1]OXG34707.1 solute carrier family 30 (zinc transporter), member 1 [Cry